jgi:hypothetical protein
MPRLNVFGSSTAGDQHSASCRIDAILYMSWMRRAFPISEEKETLMQRQHISPFYVKEQAKQI